MSAGEVIPIDGLVKMDMALDPVGSSRMGNSGESIIGRTGPTLWRLQVVTDRLSMAEARTWDAWLARRLHNGETFLAWKLFREKPAGALGTADGAITLSVDISGSKITLGGVGAYVASPGDMISYRTLADGYYLGMVQNTVTAVAGTATDLEMIPRPVAKHATTPAVRRVRAYGEFELTTRLDPFEDYTNRSLSFEARQVPR